MKTLKKPRKKAGSGKSTVSRTKTREAKPVKTAGKKALISEKSSKKSLKKASADLKNAERRKVLELQKELDSLNKKKEEEISIKDAEGRSYCQDESCDQPAVTDKYCRYHYLNGWKYRRNRNKLLKNFYLTDTIQSLLQSFGEGALHFILRDCKNEKAFESACREMNFLTEEEEETIHSEETATI